MDDFKRMDAARDFPAHTCGASRHLQIVAEEWRKSDDEELRHVAESIAAVVAELWERRKAE